MQKVNVYLLQILACQKKTILKIENKSKCESCCKLYLGNKNGYSNSFILWKFALNVIFNVTRIVKMTTCFITSRILASRNLI